MADVLIRNVEASTLDRIDAAADRVGVSRNALLREVLARYADEQAPQELTDQDVAAFGASVSELLDEGARERAWRA